MFKYTIVRIYNPLVNSVVELLNKQATLSRINKTPNNNGNKRNSKIIIKKMNNTK